MVSARLKGEFLAHIIVDAYTCQVYVNVRYGGEKKNSRIAILFTHVKNRKMCPTVPEIFVILVVV